jgi:hypothetical protein
VSTIPDSKEQAAAKMAAKRAAKSAEMKMAADKAKDKVSALPHLLLGKTCK